MYNWSTDTTRLKKNPDQYNKWQLEQKINFGLGNEKLDKATLTKVLSQLSIDQKKRAFLEYILYDKKPTY